MTRHERGAIEVMPAADCWSYLRSQELGRLAILVDGRPEIFPVNYQLTADGIVFRTAPGTKLSHGSGSVAAFEVDGYEATTGTGWSVVVQGPLEEVTRHAGADASVYPYAAGAKEHVMLVAPERVTGRRFSWDPLAPPLWFATSC